MFLVVFPSHDECSSVPLQHCCCTHSAEFVTSILPTLFSCRYVCIYLRKITFYFSFILFGSCIRYLIQYLIILSSKYTYRLYSIVVAFVKENIFFLLFFSYIIIFIIIIIKSTYFNPFIWKTNFLHFLKKFFKLSKYLHDLACSVDLVST